MTTAPNVLRWTHALYAQATAAGLFADRRVELIDGELYEMPPMNAPHIGATMYLETLFAPLLPAGRVRFAKPIILDQDGEPEPDIAVVVPGAPLKPSQAQVQLVIEVSDATREFDRGAKLQAYLNAGIAEIWIVDLVDREMLVYRAGALASVLRPGSSEAELRPLATPNILVNIDALFRAAQQ